VEWWVSTKRKCDGSLDLDWIKIYIFQIVSFHNEEVVQVKVLILEHFLTFFLSE
jgi:hypothetical protein